MKSGIKDLIAAIIIQLVLTLPFYTASAYGLSISNVRVTSVSSNSAAIEWNTDNASNGRVRYGRTASLGFTQRHDNFIENHTLSLFNGIESDTAYFFSVESTDLAGNTASDNNSNNFYTFRTRDITPPPQVTGLTAVSTTPSSIFLSWNGLNISDLSHYVVFRNRVAIGNATANSLNDTNLSSGASFNYKVSAVDNSGNEGPQSDTLIASTSGIDSTAPIISSVDSLPLSDTTARIAWLTNENSTTEVLFGINATDRRKSSSALETNHSIVIDGLTRNLRHIFVVSSCDRSNNCANSSGHSLIAGRDTILPFINLSIPRFVSRRVIDVIGSTEPFASVALFVNDMGIPLRSLSSNEIGSSGRFIFSQIQLQQDNVIKIVITDRSGNRNQRIFETGIDTEDPTIQLNEIPSLTSKTNLTVSGSVNEPVKIKVFVETNANDTSVPSQITGLNATRIGQNFVELRWNESRDRDFSHYVVYRADASPIAVTKPSTFNLFIDALVDSGRSYTYEVSAVNIFANEGPKSEPIRVTTLRGGQILNLQHAPVDIFEDFRKPLFTANTSGNFNFGIRLNKNDGKYSIKLIFEDRAENAVIIEKAVTLDTKKPEVKIISPPSGALIFENVANEVDVIGKTKPNARVHLFVDRTPFSFFNQSFEISGLPNEIQDLPEAQLDAKCRFNVAAKSFCSTGADFSVDADSNGNFKFERVDLTTIFGGASRLTEVPVTEFRDTQLNPEGQESKRTTLVVIATDQAGHKGVATQAVRIGTCWSGNQSFDIIPLTQFQGPTFLSTESLAEGTETVYFFLNYTYIGRGANPKIKDVTLSRACSTKEVTDPRFNISCQIMPSGNSPIKLNAPENTVSWSAVTLSRFPGMDKFLENDWKAFFKAFNKELTFPFKVRITYEHDVLNDEGQSVRAKEVQTTCEQVSYVVDNSIIDPRKVLPDWLLFDAVDFLKDSMKTINEVQEQINKLIDYVAIGCLYSILARIIVKIYRIWTEFSEEKIFAKARSAFVKQGYGSFKIKYLSDADLKRCFPASASAWNAEAKLYQAQRWACDRIFGHSAPSAWTETEDDTELHRRITSEKTCASDFDTRGIKFRAENCRGLTKNFLDLLKNKDDIPVDKKCFLVSNTNNPNNPEPSNPKGQRIYTIAEQQDPVLVSSKIYRLESAEFRFTDSFYAVKANEDTYMTSFQKTCAELCRGDNKEPKGQIESTIDFNG
ncbi:fibronectin type III domain-containing protein, partial [Candidatus Woesearchaeota archaeon]|nr:fibronectin type III domain-containing protein [Candidatus Woesearchaeota archaeon]